ncbi:MAG: exodeoxyribonuclease VII small subunit [Candidatus Margulisiibacteriota bacterium]|jgi:exodeoxyribonuclease VII small subunit
MLKEKIKELEGIVRKLESPAVDLDESFEVYEKGQKMILELAGYFNETRKKLKTKEIKNV